MNESEQVFNAIRELHPPYRGTIVGIKTAAQFGGEGNYPVAIIEHTLNGQNTQDWLPLDPKKIPSLGSQVSVSPQITPNGKGFGVKFDINF